LPRIDPSQLDLEEKVIQVNRVAKLVKGGRRFSFSALVAVGDKEGYVGVGLGKAVEVPAAVRKGVEEAKKNLTFVPIYKTTIFYPITCSYGAAKVVLRPASEGTGVIAGGAVRVILELSGVKNILTKSLGSDNVLNVARATMKCLEELRHTEEMAELRGVKRTPAKIPNPNTTKSQTNPKFPIPNPK